MQPDADWSADRNSGRAGRLRDTLFFSWFPRAPIACSTVFLSLLFSGPVLAQTQQPPETDQAVNDESNPLLFPIDENLSVRLYGGLEAGYENEVDFEDTETRSRGLQLTVGAEFLAYDWLVLGGALEAAKDWTRDDSEGALIVDEAYLKLGNEERFPLSLQGGYYKSPFGQFDSRHDAGHLTETAFEVKGNIVDLIYSSEYFEANVFAVQGREPWVLKQFAGERPDPQNQDWRLGAGIGRTWSTGDVEIKTVLGITDSIYGSEELIYFVPDRSGGLGASALVVLTAGNFSLSTQYISAVEDVNFYNEDEDIFTPSRPAAFAVELSAAHDFGDFVGFASVGYSRTWELESLLPEKQALLTAGVDIGQFEFLMEYRRQWDYLSEDDGTRSAADAFLAKAILEW